MSTKPHVWTPFLRRFTDERATDLNNTIALHMEVSGQWRASFWAKHDALDATALHIFNKLDGFRPIPEFIREKIHDAIKALLALETQIFATPEIAWPSAHLSLKEQVDLRRFLRAQQYFLAHEERSVDVIVEIIISALAHVIDALPEVPIERTSLSIPLLDCLLTTPGDVIERISSTLLSEDLHDVGLFTRVRDTIYVNACNASGVQPYQETQKQFVPASQSTLPTEELFRTYLGGTPFFNALHDVLVPFQIKRERFNEHGCIFAKSGHGKTQTLRAIVAQFLQEPDPPALFLIDSLGSLIDGIENLEVFSTTLRDRLVILDPSRPEYLPKLNFFGLKSDDLIFYLFKAIDQSFTPRQSTMISYLMEYMRHVPEPSLLKLVQVCESKQNLYPEVLPQLSEFTRAFFEGQFFGGKGDKYVHDTKTQIAQRLYTLGRLPKFTDMFSARHNLFDPYECMQSKRIVLINTDARSPEQGGLGEASAILGRYVLAQCLSAARRRPKDKRHLALLVVDEAKAYLDQQSSLILSDGRQFGLGMLLASQFPHQLEEGVRRELNTNTSIRMMAAVEYSVASQYARDMFTQPEFITRMKSYDRSHAEWAVYVANTFDRAIKINMPFGAIERMPKQTVAAQPRLTIQARLDEVRADYPGRPKTHGGPSEPEPFPSTDAPHKPGKGRL